MIFQAGITVEDIGSTSESYNLGRYLDEGPYERGSCRFISKSHNSSEMYDNKRRRLSLDENYKNWCRDRQKKSEDTKKLLGEKYKNSVRSKLSESRIEIFQPPKGDKLREKISKSALKRYKKLSVSDSLPEFIETRSSCTKNTWDKTLSKRIEECCNNPKKQFKITDGVISSHWRFELGEIPKGFRFGGTSKRNRALQINIPTLLSYVIFLKKSKKNLLSYPYESKNPIQVITNGYERSTWDSGNELPNGWYFSRCPPRPCKVIPEDRVKDCLKQVHDRVAKKREDFKVTYQMRVRDDG